MVALSDLVKILHEFSVDFSKLFRKSPGFPHGYEWNLAHSGARKLKHILKEAALFYLISNYFIFLLKKLILFNAQF